MNKLFQSYKSSFQGLSSESWMLSLVMLLNRVGGMVIPFLTVYLITELNFETDEAGIVMSCFGIGGLLGSIVGGWLTDKIGSFYIQFLSLLLASPIFIVLSTLETVLEMSLFVLLLSFINECFRPANSASIALYAKKENLTRSFSLNRLAVNLGFSFGPALGGFLAAISYAWLFYGNSIASLIAAFVFFWYFFKREKRNKKRVIEPEELTGLENTSSPYRDKWFIFFSLFCFLYACVFFQLFTIMPMFYEDSLGFNNVTIGLLLAFNGFFVFATEMPMVQFADRKFNVYINIVLGAVLLFIAFAWLLVDDSLFSCFMSMMFLSLSELLVLPFIATVAAKRSTEKNRGSYMGLQGLSISMAFVVMPILATRLVQEYSFSYLWWANIIVLIIVIFGFYFIKSKMPVTIET
nr:MFS transporter [uncultured Brumimicrobium sp.]